MRSKNMKIRLGNAPISVFAALPRIVWLTIGSLLVVCVALAWILYTHGPRVRFVKTDFKPFETALTLDASMTLYFDRPLAATDISKAISFSPELKFDAKIKGQTVLIAIKENVRSGRTYTLHLDPSVQDTAGKTMRSEYTYSFTIGPARYAYIERNYGTDYMADVPRERNDYIKIGTVGQETRTVFAYPNIRSFAANSSYAVVVGVNRDEDVVFLVNLQTKEVQNVKLLFGGRITALSIAPQGSVALLSVQPEYTQVSADYYVDFAYRLVSLDLRSGAVASLSQSNGEYVKGVSVQLDRHGQFALVQDEKQSFYALSPYNDYDPVLIGAFGEAFTIDSQSGELLFRSSDNFIRYKTDTSERIPAVIPADGYVSQVQKGRSILYSSLSYASETSQSRVQSLADWNTNPTIVWEQSLADSSVMRSFTASYDESVLALQTNPESCQYDDIGLNTQCKEAQTILYDTNAKRQITNFPGFDVVWLP